MVTRTVSYRLRAAAPQPIKGQCPTGVDPNPGTVGYVLQTFLAEQNTTDSCEDQDQLLCSTDMLGLGGDFVSASYTAQRFLDDEGELLFVATESREPEYIEVAKISTAMYGHYRHFLQIVQAIRFMDYESTVTVNEPVSFDLKTEVELMAEFKSTQEGMPDSIRLEAFLRLVNERYAQDKIARKLAEICVDYTIFVLYTSAELNERLASGTIVKGDIIKANYVYQAVSDLYYSNQLNLFEEPVETFASIRTKIDTYLNKLIENLGSVNIEDMEDIDLNDDPEL